MNVRYFVDETVITVTASEKILDGIKEYLEAKYPLVCITSKKGSISIQREVYSGIKSDRRDNDLDADEDTVRYVEKYPKDRTLIKELISFNAILVSAPDKIAAPTAEAESESAYWETQDESMMHIQKESLAVSPRESQNSYGAILHQINKKTSDKGMDDSADQKTQKSTTIGDESSKNKPNRIQFHPVLRYVEPEQKKVQKKVDETCKQCIIQ